MTTATQFSEYDLSTGVFNGRVMSGEPSVLVESQLPGHAWYPGARDHRQWRVDIATGQCVEYQPPAPSDTELITWRWDTEARRWVPQPTTAHFEKEAKAMRDRLLSLSVGRQLQAYRTGVGVAEVEAYVAAVAAVESLPGYPQNVQWPTPPWA